MKFKYRIALSAAAGAAFLIAGAFGVLYPVLQSGANLQQLHLEETLLTEQVVRDADRAGHFATLFLATGASRDRLAFEDAAQTFEQDLAGFEASAAYHDHGEGSEAQYTSDARVAWSDARSVVDAAGTGTPAGDASGVLLSDALSRLDASLADLTAHERDEASEAVSLVLTSISQARVAVLILGLLGIAFIIISAAAASRSVASRLAELNVAVRDISAGNLDQAIPAGGKDEVGELAAAFESMRLSLRSALGSLQDQVTERAAVEEALGRANDELSALLDSARQSHVEMDLMAEMGELLQADLTWSEAYAVIASHGRRLFPEMQGALYLYSDGEKELARVADWGESEPMANSYRPDQCWSLRTGKTHWVTHDEPDLPPCAHLRSTETCSACAPLVAHGEVLGTIVIRGLSQETALTDAARSEHVRGTFASFAGRIALAISNIELRETLREQSLRDPLTGLSNRRLMEEALKREISRSNREGSPLAVGLIDVDFFKVYNDTYGHEAGDEVLRQVVAYLRDNTRAGDVVCRYGGEEFVVVWSGLSSPDATARAESLRRGVAALEFVSGGAALGGITLSIGVATLGAHGETGPELLAAADLALYEAKADGRDKVVLAADSAHAGGPARAAG